jgi:hypothetical protein
MGSEMEFVRWKTIKYNPRNGEVNLSWVEREPGANKNTTTSKKCPNEPLEAFKSALRDLREHVVHLVAITGAEQKKQMEQIEVRGVNFSEDKNGERAQMIIVRRIPQGDGNMPLNYNTPALHCYLHDEESEVPAWSADCVSVLDRLKDAAMDYRDGGRLPVSELTGDSSDKDGELFEDDAA